MISLNLVHHNTTHSKLLLKRKRNTIKSKLKTLWSSGEPMFCPKNCDLDSLTRHLEMEKRFILFWFLIHGNVGILTLNFIDLKERKNSLFLLGNIYPYI